MSDENKRLAKRFHVDLFEEKDLDVADKILSEDFSVGTPGVPAHWSSGREGAKRFASDIAAAFPDVAFEHHEVLAEGDKVVVRWTLTGTHGGELLGVPPTGKPVKFGGFDLFQIEDGKITKLWQTWDHFGFLVQIGALAIPAEASA
jgi:steroid delta-isomerase-like uncharacterized protein